MTEEERLKDNKQTRRTLILVCLGFIVFIIYNIYRVNSPEPITPNVSTQKIHCMVCGKDLSNTYQRIAPNGDKYYCMPCYNNTMNDIYDEMRSEGYNTDDYTDRGY